MSQQGANVQIYPHSFADGAHTSLLDLEEHFNQDLASKFGGSDVELDGEILLNNRPTAASPPNQQQHVLLYSQSEVSNKQVSLNGSGPTKDEMDFRLSNMAAGKNNKKWVSDSVHR